MESDSDLEILECAKLPMKRKHQGKSSMAPPEAASSSSLAKKTQYFNIERGIGSPPETIPLLLAKNRKNEDPTNWWISEKLDGVRCYWNGRNFISRLGNPYSAPPYFIENLPKTVSLDGELWLGRKMFQDCVSIARCTDNGKNDMTRWRNMKYMIFDAPSLRCKFEERQDYLTDLVSQIKNSYIEVVEQTRCVDKSHMLEMLEKIESLGGEGIMLRQPESMYEGKRSSTLLKVKTFCDAEAVVIGYETGKGKYADSVGALKVRNEEGKEFKLGSGLTDQDRLEPPPIGSKVTYRYQELSKDGIPRFPTYFRKYLT